MMSGTDGSDGRCKMNRFMDKTRMRHNGRGGLDMGNGLLSVACAGLLLCMGCSEDSLVPDKDGLTGKQVVVDYTVEEAVTRGVSHEALPANERIKSLVYLLYDDAGNLVKQREIPGISSMKVGDWPMKRSTMSWDQREALKDTLEQGQTYTVVFIANTDPSLFGEEEVLHLTETVDGEQVAASLDDVYLSLPTTKAFGDNNMFYLFKKEITPNGYDRENYCNCPVQLQRIVCRTDFFSDDYQAWDTEFTKGKIRDFTDSKVYDVLLATDNKMPLGVQSWLDDFISKFSSFATSKAYSANTDFTSWFNSFKSAVNGLDYSTYIKNMGDADKQNVQELLYNSCLQNETLKGLWLPWKGLQAKVAYSSRADRFYVNGKTANVGDVAVTDSLSPFLDVTQLTETGTDGSTSTQNTFTLIGFGENAGATAGSELNKMTEIRLYESVSATSPVSVISIPTDKQSFAGQGGNSRVQLVYCPIKSLEYNQSVTTGKTYSLEVDIKSAVESAMDIYSTCSDKLDEFFSDDAGSKYGTGLEKFILQITLPDLSNNSALTVTPEWSEK